MKGTNVRISEETHAKLVAHTEKNGMKIGKFVDKAVLDKIEPESMSTFWNARLLKEKEINEIIKKKR